MQDRSIKRDPEPEGEVFGRRLREIRQARHVTQEALSVAAGLTESYISNMERGLKIPSLTTMLRLARGLRCNVADLVAVFDEPREPRRAAATKRQ